MLIELAFSARIGGGLRLLYLLVALPLSWWVGQQYAGVVLEQVASPLFAATPANPWDRESLRLLKRLDQVPEWQQRTRGLSRMEKDKIGFDLSGKGSSRLDDETLLFLASVLRDGLAKIDESVCAAMLRSSATPAQLRQALEKLDAASLERYMDAAYNAIVAELKGVPPPSVSPEEQAAAARALLEQVPKDWRPRLVQILQMPKFRSDEEVCWAGRTVTYYLTSLSDRDQRVMMRALVQ